MKAYQLIFVGFAFTAAGCVSQAANEPATVADAAKPEVSAAEGEQVASTEEEPREICRREQITGSKFFKTFCYTPEEYEQLQKRTEETRQQIRKTIRAQSHCGERTC